MRLTGDRSAAWPEPSREPRKLLIKFLIFFKMCCRQTKPQLRQESCFDQEYWMIKSAIFHEPSLSNFRVRPRPQMKERSSFAQGRAAEEKPLKSTPIQ